jgi:hypothetical protein
MSKQYASQSDVIHNNKNPKKTEHEIDHENFIVKIWKYIQPIHIFIAD